MTQDNISQSMNQRLNYVKGKFHTQNINLHSYEPRHWYNLHCSHFPLLKSMVSMLPMNNATISNTKSQLGYLIKLWLQAVVNR